ncbi:MAG: hypothetical protein HZC28_02300 [Spirochaetes bacterium]|nr:hypothetical protein [Spirochaetota bacterium]
MKKNIILHAVRSVLCIMIFSAAVWAESAIDSLNCHRIEASWVYARSAYYYPVSSVAYDSPELGVPLSLSAALRAYGSYYFVSTKSFDVIASASWHFPVVPHMLRLRTGAGGVLNARLYSDSRSTAESGFDPFLIFGADASFDWWTVSLPAAMRFYRDGCGISLIPDAALRFGTFGVFIRSEITMNARWSGTTQWTADHFAGLRMYL